MARDESIDLDTFKASSYLDPNFVLTVQPCALVSLPDALHGHLSAEELRDRVKSGSVWVTRAASCYFELKADFEGFPSGAVHEDLVHVVIKAFESLPAWQILGIEIRRDYNRFLDLPGTNSPYTYSIHHAQTSTGLVAPSQVPNVLLSKVVCNMTFGPRKQPEAGIRVEDTNKPRRTKVVTVQLPRHQLQNIATRSTTKKRSERQLRICSRKPKAVTAQELCRNSQVLHKDDLGIHDLEVGLRDSRIEHLTYVAINLVLGIRKRFFGFKSDRKLHYPTLLDIAPAVWNAHYFQEIMSRAQLAPLISSALGSMMGRSPTYLGNNNTQYQASDPAATLQKRMIQLILRSTSLRFPSFGGRSVSSSNVNSQDNPGLIIAADLAQRAQSPCGLENSILSQDSISSFVDVEGDQDIEQYQPHPLGESGTLYSNLDLGQGQDLTQMPSAMNQDHDYIPRSDHLSDTIEHISTDILDGELEEQHQRRMHDHEPTYLSAIGRDDDIVHLEHSDIVRSEATSFATLNHHCIPEYVYPNIWTSVRGSSTDCHDNDHPDEMYLEAAKERAMLLDDELLLSNFAASD